MVYLIYIGLGSALHDVPARDLTKEEADRYGGSDYLVSTGLYKLAAPEKKFNPPASNSGGKVGSNAGN